MSEEDGDGSVRMKINPYELLVLVAEEFKGLPAGVCLTAASVLKAFLMMERAGDQHGQLVLLKLACEFVGDVAPKRPL